MSSLGFIVHLEVNDSLSDAEYANLKMQLADVTLQQVRDGLERLDLASTTATITGFALTEGLGLGISLTPPEETTARHMVPSPFGPLPAPTDDELRQARSELGSFPVGQEAPRVEG